MTRFDVSDYEPPEGNEIEKRGLWPSTVLVEPLEVGKAIVEASVLFHGIPVSINILKHLDILNDC